MLGASFRPISSRFYAVYVSKHVSKIRNLDQRRIPIDLPSMAIKTALFLAAMSSDTRLAINSAYFLAILAQSRQSKPLG